MTVLPCGKDTGDEAWQGEYRLFWLTDDLLADSENLSAPKVLVEEIMEEIQTVLEQFGIGGGDEE